MKKLNISTKAFALLFTLILCGCLKDDVVTLDGAYVEWDAASFNANAAGRTYPIITRVPRGGEPVNNADPLINSNSGTIAFRVNLVGAHRSTATEFNFVAVEGEEMPNANHDPAVSGIHYTTTGRVVIPANSSFGQVEISLVETPSAGRSVFLVLEIQGAGDIAPMEREKRIGISIPQVSNTTQ